jgi:hypothetical protein
MAVTLNSVRQLIHVMEKNYVFCHIGNEFFNIITTYKMGSGLDDWIYWRLVHNTRKYRKYSAIADLHTLQFTAAHALRFSVFTSRILATGL